MTAFKKFPREYTDEGHRQRSDRARIRRQLRAGEIQPWDVLRERPSSVASLSVAEILVMSRGLGRERVAKLNKLALRDGINLLTQVDRVSERTIDWLEERILPYARWGTRGIVG